VCGHHGQQIARPCPCPAAARLPGYPQTNEQREHVVGEELIAQRPVGIRGPAVRLQLDGDDPALRSEPVCLALHLPDRHQRPVQHEQRRPRPVGLEIQVEATDARVLPAWASWARVHWCLVSFR
jgi:hypothetical protein